MSFFIKNQESWQTLKNDYDDCTFVLLGLSGDSDTTDYLQRVEQVYADVHKKIKKWIERLIKSLRISITTNWRMAALNHSEQEVLSAGERLGRRGKLLYAEDLQYKSTKKPMFTTVSSVIKVGQSKAVKAADLQFLADIVEADEAHFPWNRETLQGEEVLNYSSSLQKSPFGPTKLDDVCNTDKIMKGLSIENGHAQMSKVMSYAALWGHALYYPIMEEQPVITDFSFLADVIHKLMCESAPRSCDLRCLGNQIPCWTFEDLMKTWTGTSKEQILLVLRLLEKHGCLFKFAIDPWSSIKDVSFVYVLYKDLPDKPSVPLEHFWPIETPLKMSQGDKYFFCDPGLPQSFFPNLLRHAFKLGGQMLVWKQGVVIQKGSVTILIEKIKEYDGLPVVVIQVRAPIVYSTSSPKNELLWSSMKLYASIMDHLVLKYNICVAKSVPCTNCAPKSRYEILASKEVNRFFLEHLVRVGEQRDVRCKQCDAASIAYSQIGHGDVFFYLYSNKNMLFISNMNFYLKEQMAICVYFSPN